MPAVAVPRGIMKILVSVPAAGSGPPVLLATWSSPVWVGRWRVKDELAQEPWPASLVLVITSKLKPKSTVLTGAGGGGYRDARDGLRGSVTGREAGQGLGAGVGSSVHFAGYFAAHAVHVVGKCRPVRTKVCTGSRPATLPVLREELTVASTTRTE